MARKKMRPMLPVRVARLHGRLLISTAIGLLLTLAVWPTDWRIPTKLLAGFDVGVLLYIALVTQLMISCGVTEIKRRAAEDDEGALILLGLVCVAALASVAAIVAELANSKSAPPGQAAAQIMLGMVTIVLCWTFVHTIFALHYAHEYYGERRDQRIGGLKFPGNEAPDYWDFVYFSLVIAMTSQVSDVAIDSKSIRRVATVHGVLSFFFNLAILALTFNMVSNLIAP